MPSLTKIIKEKEFLELVKGRSQNLLKVYNFLHGKGNEYTRRFYGYLIQETEELESFLDDYCARDNRTWYYYGELVASIRNIGKAAFILKHILNRYPSYLLKDKTNEFFTHAKSVLAIFDEAILCFFEELKKEAKKLEIGFPRETLQEEVFAEIYPKKRLPHTINEKERLDSKKMVARIATQYLGVVRKFEDLRWNCGRYHLKNLKNLIPDRIDEEKSREVMSLIHNLQSTYDHHIKHTFLESQDGCLYELRSHISMPLHLLSIINWLSHFYERHARKTGYDRTRNKIASIIDETKLLDIIVNFALFYCSIYLAKGKRLAMDILKKYTEVATYELKIPEKLGFHLRPASLVAKVSNHYGTKVQLIVDGKEYDAGSVLSITMAAGLIARRGYKTVLMRGDKRALEDIKLLSRYNYGEDEKGNPAKIPQELSYLWS